MTGRIAQALRFLHTPAYSPFLGNDNGQKAVNIAFIGVGRMASGNIGYCANVPGFEIVAVCDVYQAGARFRGGTGAQGAVRPASKAVPTS